MARYRTGDVGIDKSDKRWTAYLYGSGPNFPKFLFSHPSSLIEVRRYANNYVKKTGGNVYIEGQPAADYLPNKYRGFGAVQGGRSWDPRGAWPTEGEVLHELRGIQREMERGKIEEDNYVDVRLQVNPADGEWTVHYGPSDYDQDHRGYWGSSSVNIDDDDATLRDTAAELISQATEHAAQDED